MLAGLKIMPTFATHLRKTDAQMAELVDALVSNTSGFTSMPVRSRLWVLKRENSSNSDFPLFYLFITHRFICISHSPDIIFYFYMKYRGL